MKENTIKIDTKNSIIKSVLVEDFLSSLYSLLVKVINVENEEVLNLTVNDFQLYTQNDTIIPIKSVLEVEEGLYKLFFVLEENHICERESSFHVKVLGQDLDKPKAINGIIYPSVDNDREETKIILPFVDNEPEFPTQHRMGWVVNGESTTGSNNKNRAEGVLNRTAFQLYHNIVTLKNAIDGINSKYFDIWKGYDEIVEQFEKNKEKLEELQSNVEEATAKAEEFVGNYKAYVDGRFDEVNTKIFDLEVMQKLHDNKLEYHERAIRDLKEKEPHFLQLLSEAEEDRNLIKGNVSELESKVDSNKEELDKTISDLDTKFESNKEELNSKIESNKDATDKSISDLESKVGSNKEEFDSKFEDIESTIKDIHDIRDIDKENIDNKFNDIDNNHKQLKDDLFNLNNNVQMLDNKSEDHELRISNNKESIDEINDKLVQIDTTLLDQSNYTQENIDRIDDVNQKQDDLIKNLSEDLFDSNISIQMLDNKSEDHEKRITKNKTDLSNLSNEFSSYRDTTDQELSKINDSLNKGQTSIDNKIDEFMEELDKVNSDIQSNKKEIEKTNEVLFDSNINIQMLDNKSEDHEVRISNNTKDINEIKVDLSSHKNDNEDKFESIESKFNEVDSSIKKNKDDIFEHSITLQLLDNKSEDHEKRISKNTKDIKGNFDLTNASLNDINENLNDLKDKDLSIDVEIDSIKDKVSKNENEITLINKDILDIRSDLQDHGEVHKEDIDLINKGLEDLESKHQDDIESINDSLSTHNDRIDLNVKNLNELKDDVESEFVLVNQNIVNNKEVIDKDIKSIKEDINSNRIEIESNKNLIDTKASEEYVDSLNAEINSNLSKINSELNTKVDIGSYTTDMQKVALKEDLGVLEGVVETKRSLDNNVFSNSITLTQLTRAEDSNKSTFEIDENGLSITNAIGGFESTLVLPSIDGKQTLATEEYVVQNIGNIDLSPFATKDQVDLKADITYVDSEIENIDFTPYALKDDVEDSLSRKLEKEDLDGLASEQFVNESINRIENKVDTKVDAEYVQSEIDSIDYSIFATKEELQSDVNQLTVKIDAKIEEKDIEDRATYQYVDTKFNSIDLTPYALKDDVDNSLSLKLEAKDIQNLSTIDYVDSKIDLVNKEVVLKADTVYVDSKFEDLESNTIDGLATKDELLKTNSRVSELESTSKEQESKLALQEELINTKVDAKFVQEQIDSVDHSEFASKNEVELKADKTDLLDKVTKEELEESLEVKLEKSDLEGLASEEYVNSKVDSIDLTPYATKEELSTKADISYVDDKVEGLATETYVMEQINAIPVVDLTPYATIESVDEKLSLKADLTDLESFATKEEVANKANSSDLDLLEYGVIQQLETKADKSDLEGLATESFVKEQIEAVDHSEFATKEEVITKADKASLEALDNEINKALETKADKSLLEGFAKESYVDEKISSIEIPEVNLEPYAKTKDVNEQLNLKADKTDLEVYASKEEVSIKADKVYVDSEISKIEIPSIEGLATENFVKEQIEAVDHSEFVDKSELENKLSNKADKDELSNLASTDYVDSKFGDIDLTPYAKSIDVQESLDLKADKESLTGLATEEYVNSEIDKIDLESYATKEDLESKVDVEAFNSEISKKIEKEDLNDYAKESYVDEKFGSIDLEPYATKDSLEGYAKVEDLAVKANKSELEGLATEEFVTEQIKSIPEVDLTPYAKVADVDSKLDLKADKSDLDGLATESFVKDQIEAVDHSEFATKEEVNTKADKESLGSLESDINKALEAKADKTSLEGLAKESYVDERFNSIEIPEVNLEPYAKTEYVKEQLNLKADRTDLEAYATTEELTLKADKDYVDSEISKIEIPSIEGLATESFVKEQIEAVDHSEFATKEELALKANKTELEGLATEDYVDTKVSSIDLDPYATKEELSTKADISYVDSEISKIEIPSIDGLATEEFVTEQIKSIPEVDLTPYATKESLNDYVTVEQSKEFAKTDYVDQEISKLPLGEYVKEDDLKPILETKADKDSLVGLATEDYVKSEIDKIEVDLTPYATKEELSTKADKSELKGLATEEFVKTTVNNSDFVKKEEFENGLSNKVDNDSLKDYAKLDDLKEFAKDTDLESKADISYVDEKVSSINIPSIEGLATEDYVKLEIGKIDLEPYATKEELFVKADKTDLEGFAKESYVDEKISLIEIPEVDLTDYAKTKEVDDKLNLKADKTVLEVYATKEELESKADISYVDQEIGKIEVPSIEGLATEEYVNSKVEGIDLTPYAKTEDVNKSLETKADKESLVGLASEEYVNSKVESIDLTPYAKTKDLELKADKTYVDSEISKIEIPSIEGLAKESYVDERFNSIDLEPYATKEDLSTKVDKGYVDQEISKIGIPEVDLTPYAKTEEIEEQLNLKADKTDLEDYLTVVASKDFATKEDLENVDNVISSLASKEYVEESLESVVSLEVLHDFTTPRLYKVDRYNPVFSKKGLDLYIKKGTKVIFGDSVLNINEDAKIDITDTLKGGEDYVVYVDREGKFTVLADPFETPHTPLGNQFLLGGFHNSDIKELENDWDSLFKSAVIGINAYSLWDINFRANGIINSIGSVRFGQLSNHGMVYDARTNRWVALYFTSTNVDKYGLSKYDSNIASGTVLPTKPKLFGNGEYDNLNWWTANEIVSTHGARLLYENEFNSRALGVKENFGIESGLSETAKKTEHIASLTSYLGCEQTVGVQWYWGMDSSFRYDGSMPSHKDVTEGKGSVYTQGDYGIVRALFGGSPTDEKTHIGSKHTMWMAYPWFSSWDVSIVASKEHLIL